METNKNKEKPNEDKTKTLRNGILILLGILFAILIARYITEEEFRLWVDTNIFKRELEQDTLSIVELNYDTTPNIFAYDKYVAVLNKNKLDLYTSDGTKNAELEVKISKPVMSSYGKYLVLAESNGSKLYLISGNSILWQKDVEGNISRVNINKNGYVSVIITNTTYKSVIVSYTQSGKELFKTFLSSTYAICSDISNNNKYLAIGEVDYSGTIVKSNVKIISIALAQTNPENSIINKYESASGEIVSNIKYQDKDYAICMFNKYIQKVGTKGSERLLDFDNNCLFVDINLRDSVAIVKKQSSGLFSYEYEMQLKSTLGNSENLYILDSNVPKDVLISGNIIGIDLGTEVQIVNSKGILLKKYKANQEIKGLAIGENIAGIIYKDKIELINL